jgi:hypothetical protein
MAGIAVIVGLPIALGVAFGWPLPTSIPTSDAIASTPLRFVDPTVILNAFVCLAWVSWAVLTGYTVRGVVDSMRGRPGRRQRIAPLATLAGKITGSVLLLASLTRPVTVAALPPSAISIGLDSPTNLDRETTGPQEHPNESTVAEPAPTVDPTYVVQRGDTLWDIAEARLGDPFRWPEIRDLNPVLLAEPNLICSGWELTLPRDATSASAIPAPTPQPTASLPDEPSPSVELATPTDAEPTTTLSTTPTPAPAPAPAPAPQDQTTESTAAGASDGSFDLDTALVGLAGTTALATGLMLLLRRRRRNAAPGPLPYYRPSELEQNLVAASDVPLVRWVGQALGWLGDHLTGRTFGSVPIAVEYSEATGIEILWDQPASSPPEGWTSEPGGWSWHRPYDPEAPVPEAEHPSVLPGLVTFGQRDGRQLLVNLEAYGTVAIAGDPGAAEDLFRALVVELATGDEIGQARVLVSPEAQVLPRSIGIDAVAADQALAELESVTKESEALLGQAGCATTFAYRTCATPVLPLDVTVVAGDSHTPALREATAATPAHRGGVVLLLGQSDDAACRIEVGGDGTATMDPLGIEFTPAALAADTVDEIDDLLESTIVVPADDEPGPLRAWWVDDLAGESAVAASAVQETFDLDEVELGSNDQPLLASPRMTVKVLGAPRLVDGPALSRRELAVVALVACSSRPITHEQVQDAIWGSSPISAKSVFNLISSARRSLGSWDGVPVLSAASRPDSTITLHPEVGTDLELLRSLYEAAQQSPSADATQHLVRALEMVEGPPFDAAGYDWAISEQLVSEAEQLIEQAATACAHLALEAGEVERARWALGQGLRALPGDEMLYRLRMRVEDAAGNPAGVRRVFQELEAHLDDFGLTPSTATVDLLRELSTATAERGDVHTTDA